MRVASIFIFELWMRNVEVLNYFCGIGNIKVTEGETLLSH